LARNRRHYSLLGAAGPSAVAAVAERVGAGVHFNAFARVDPLGCARIKYGVVALPTLLRDLRDWDALYVAGRMHKPVATLRADGRVAAAAEGNLVSALACALLLLPVRGRARAAWHHARAAPARSRCDACCAQERFSERQLHATLCGLSYTGDVRMAIAEDASKVRACASCRAHPARSPRAQPLCAG
jgi:translocator assembly and maintenance protein 41